MGEWYSMEMQKNELRKRKLCEKRLGAKLFEFASSREFRKFLLLDELLEKNSDNSDNTAYFENEMSLYKEEVLFDFRILSENKNLKIQLC